LSVALAAAALAGAPTAAIGALSAGGETAPVSAAAADNAAVDTALVDVVPVGTAPPGFTPPAWHLSVGLECGGLDRYDVFEREDVEPPALREPGYGVGLEIGRRLGDRFLVGFRAGVQRFDDENDEAAYFTVEAAFTAAVELRSAGRWRPYLKGGLGGFGTGFDAGDFLVTAWGSLASLAVGSRHHLNRWFSLDLELAGLAWNPLEARRTPEEGVEGEEETWDLRGESFGWHTRLGFSWWF
jgi:hypothetical protein